MTWISNKPLVCLAPMEDYTDSPYRRIVRKIAPKVVLFTEFISVDGLKHNPGKVGEKFQFHSDEHPIVVQLFGNDPEGFAHAVKMLSKYDIAGIDINMGCPAKKIVKVQCGAHLIRDAELAWKIADETVKASPFPVTVKTRLGWENKQDIFSFAEGFEKRGVKGITVHGRTYKQGFSGEADWEPIYALKKKTAMKVIGNGDIKSGKDAIDKLKNLDGVMVGRAAMGNPWLLQEVFLLLQNDTYTSVEVSFQDKIPTILEHCKLSSEIKGERRGMIEMRKHLAAYVKEMPGAKGMRGRLVRVEKIDEVKEILQNSSPGV